MAEHSLPHPETVWQIHITDIATGLRELRKEVESHSAEDTRRFGEVNASLSGMRASMDQLVQARAEQVGAARAIAELAERKSRELSEENATRSREQSARDAKRGRDQTRIMWAFGIVFTVIQIMIQKHWF